MNKAEYTGLLLNPRWQRRRLEIMKRDNFSCLLCQNPNDTLHVHHLDYIDGLKPWEYEDYFLITTCEECHKWLHSLRGMPLHVVGLLIAAKLKLDRIKVGDTRWTSCEDRQNPSKKRAKEMFDKMREAIE
jgi:5-methylcytosine-specific restriction endonuclease McrA